MQQWEWEVLWPHTPHHPPRPCQWTDLYSRSIFWASSFSWWLVLYGGDRVGPTCYLFIDCNVRHPGNWPGNWRPHMCREFYLYNTAHVLPHQRWERNHSLSLSLSQSLPVSLSLSQSLPVWYKALQSRLVVVLVAGLVSGQHLSPHRPHTARPVRIRRIKTGRAAISPSSYPLNTLCLVCLQANCNSLFWITEFRPGWTDCWGLSVIFQVLKPKLSSVMGSINNYHYTVLAGYII